MAAHAKATNLAPTVETTPVTFGRRQTVIQAPIDRVYPNPSNPRGDHYDTADLELTIAAVGQLQPVIAYKDGDGWTLVSGHRRRLALKRLGRNTIDLVECKSPEDAVVVMAAYNVQQPIPPTKLAAAIQHMTDSHGWTTERAGRALGLSADKAALVRSINDAPPTVREALDKGKITLQMYKHMPRRAPADVQVAVVEAATNKDGKVTVDSIRKATRQARETGQAAPPQRPTLAADTDTVARINALRNELMQLLAQIPTLNEIDQARAEVALNDLRTMIERSLQ